MKIENFVAQSEGEWKSMRSGHSLAFRQFEQVISKITVKLLKRNDPIVLELLRSINQEKIDYIAPFHIKWEIEDFWETEDKPELKPGSCVLIPMPNTSNSGVLFRSRGYTEPIQSLSSYYFLSDGTFILETKYDQTITEERIWFLSKLVRCRSSVVYTSKKTGIIQTSFASEVKLLNPKESQN